MRLGLSLVGRGWLGFSKDRWRWMRIHYPCSTLVLGLWPETDSELSASEGTTARNLPGHEHHLCHETLNFKVRVPLQEYRVNTFRILSENCSGYFCLFLSVNYQHPAELCHKKAFVPLVNFVTNPLLEG